jgi:hypothetical protein
VEHVVDARKHTTGFLAHCALAMANAANGDTIRVIFAEAYRGISTRILTGLQDQAKELGKDLTIKGEFPGADQESAALENPDPTPIIGDESRSIPGTRVIIFRPPPPTAKP